MGNYWQRLGRLNRKVFGCLKQVFFGFTILLKTILNAFCLIQ